MQRLAVVIAIVGIGLCRSFGGSTRDDSAEEATETASWEYSLSTATYFSPHARDYVNPVFTADRDWLHLEARYNYEALKTGSVWLGYNFGFGDKLAFELTPMIGGVFGDLTGVATGYAISIGYKPIEFFTQGEYFFDAATHAENFFYTWSELSCSFSRWFRVGVVVDRTKALGTAIDIRRGPLVGFTYKDVDLTTYWLSPGSNEPTVIFAVTVSF